MVLAVRPVLFPEDFWRILRSHCALPLTLPDSLLEPQAWGTLTCIGLGLGFGALGPAPCWTCPEQLGLPAGQPSQWEAQSRRQPCLVLPHCHREMQPPGGGAGSPSSTHASANTQLFHRILYCFLSKSLTLRNIVAGRWII